MQTRYVAYGLDLRSSFPLPGMTAATSHGLPSLALELTTPRELTAAWSGASGPPAWRGKLSDGSWLTAERGSAGDLLFAYGDRARFRLDAAQELLECAPSDERLDWQRALIGKVLCSVSVMRGYEALHAAAVDSPRGVLAFAGPSGAGKSTLAREFARRGWPLFADDVLTLSSGPSGVHAHPATPHMTLAEDSADTLDADEFSATLATLAGERWMVADRASRDPAPVRMLCLLNRGRGSRLDARVLPANPLLLAPHMLGFRGDGERQRRRFHLYADLLGSATLVELSGDLEDPPRDLADVVERVLGYRPALAGRAA